jgi:hypothetical protein
VAFDRRTAHAKGLLKDTAGNPLTLDGLWELLFGGGGSAGDPHKLYFTSGPDDENHGLLGSWGGGWTVVPCLCRAPRERFEDSAVSVKWVAREGVLQEHGSAPSVAVELSALLPSVRGEDRPGGELVGIASARALGWTWHVNGGSLVEPGGDEPGVIWGVILERGVWGPVRAWPS